MVGRFPIRYGERIGFEGGEVYASVPKDFWNHEDLEFFKSVLQKEGKISVLGELPVIFSEDEEVKKWENIAKKYGVEYIRLV